MYLVFYFILSDILWIFKRKLQFDINMFLVRILLKKILGQRCMID